MRKIIGVLLLLTAVSVSYSKDWTKIFNQEGYEQETLFDSSIKSVGGYFAFDTYATLINEKVYPVFGGEFGAIINHSFIIGGAGRGLLLSTSFRHRSDETNNYQGGGWGGLLLGYSFLPEYLIHPYVKVIIGSGSLGYYYNKDDYGGWAFFASEAIIGVDFNLTKWMRVSPYAGYRYVYGNINIMDLTDSKLSGFTGGLSIAFGLF